MTVIISNGNTALSTVNGFYRVEAHNLSCFSTTTLVLSTPRTIALTFANSGNCIGSILALYFNGDYPPAQFKAIVCKLQENVASVWTDRASVTLSGTNLVNLTTGLMDSGNGGQVFAWLVPFIFTAPYAVDTTAGKWRLEISLGAGTYNSYLLTSNGTIPFHATWCDNAVSFANNDCVIAKDIVTIDQTATFRGVLGTGETVYSVAAIAPRSLTPSAPTSGFEWQNPPVSAYTLTIDGMAVMSGHSRFTVGSEASPIPNAQMATIASPATPTAGTAVGFISPCANLQYMPGGRWNLALYGEVPTYEVTRLVGQENTGDAILAVTDNVNWVNGDKVIVGKALTPGASDVTVYTVSSVVGTTITLTGNLAGSHRAANAPVIVLNRRGIKLLNIPVRTGIPLRFNVSGVEMNNSYFMGTNQPVFKESDEVANQSKAVMTHCTAQSTSANRYMPFYDWQVPYLGMDITYCYLHENSFFRYCYWIHTKTLLTVQNCIFMNVRSRGTFYGTGYWKFDQNEIYGIEGGVYGPVIFNGVGCEMTNNRWWGGTSYSFVYPACYTGTIYNMKSWRNNKYDNNYWGMGHSGNTLGLEMIDDVYNSERANLINDIYVPGYLLYDVQHKNSTGIVNLNITTGQPNFIEGSEYRFHDYNGTANSHKVYKPYGNFQSTGNGLADTTAHTAGGFAIRFESISSIEKLEWMQIIPTGNIQNKSMTVYVWCKINNANYYSATHQKPRLTINFDNGTLAYAEALGNTNWQLLSVTFTPTTTYGQITATLSTMTDQTTSNAYVYFDDYGILFPAGHQLNLGNMDLWANALPVAPTIATNLSAQDVWTALQTTDYGAGTMGELVKEIDKTTGDNQALILGS